MCCQNMIPVNSSTGSSTAATNRIKCERIDRCRMLLISARGCEVCLSVREATMLQLDGYAGQASRFQIFCY